MSTPDQESISAEYVATWEMEEGDRARSPALTQREEGRYRESGEFIVVQDGTRLSSDQRRVAGELLRLYHSLCGGQPGQPWPQALLDSSGKFNRAVFPAPPSRRGK
jgi:hypothetical protein